MTSVGRCFRIPGFNQTARGYGFGVGLVIEIPWTLYTPSINQINDNGIVIKLAEKEKGLDYDLKLIPTGTHTIMPLRATLYDFMNDPPRYTCLQNQAQNYSRVECFDNCVYEEASVACKCSPVGSNNRTYPACTTFEFYGCLLSEVGQTTVNLENFATFLSFGPYP